MIILYSIGRKNATKNIRKNAIFLLTKDIKGFIIKLEIRRNAKNERGVNMMNTSKLKGIIVEKGYTQEALASDIGIDKSTFYRKIKNGGSFSIKEANAIVEAMKLTRDEAISIFFADTVA
jgi:DNA-binding XRE family transcriptional regulator